jgi:hypothetical protein
VVNGIELQPFKEIIGYYTQKYELIETSINSMKEREFKVKSVEYCENLEE